MSLSKTKVWVVGTAVLSVLLVVAAYFLLIGPKRAEAADLRQQTEETQSSNSMLESKIEQLKMQFAELPQRQAELAAIKQAMPEDESLQSLTRDLEKLTQQAGVTLMSVAPGEPVAVGAATPGAAPTASEGAESSGDAGSGEAGDGSAAAAAPAQSASSGDLLVSVPATVVVVGDFYKSELFLKSLQTEMPRAFLVESLNLQAEKDGQSGGGKPATVNGDVTMTLTGSVFVLRSADSAAASTPSAAPATPATTETN